jgi:cytochrome c-type biogenesis protein CcmE
MTTHSDISRRKTRRFILVAVAGAVLGFGAIAASGINDNLVYYWTPADLVAAGDQAYGATIRLGGMVAAGSIRRTGGTGVEFDVKDGGAVVHVRSAGVPPQMFRDDIGVVVEGTMTRAGVFESRRLMVSHNNEYQAPKAGHPVDEEELQKLMRTAKGTE